MFGLRYQICRALVVCFFYLDILTSIGPISYDRVSIQAIPNSYLIITAVIKQGWTGNKPLTRKTRFRAVKKKHGLGELFLTL